MEYKASNHLESEDWLKDFIDSAHDLIQIVSIDGTILFVNKSWSTLLGYTPEEVLGQSIYSFITEPDREHYIAYRSNVINGLTTTEKGIVFEMTKKGGGTIAVEGVVSLKAKGDVPIYTTGIFRDITARLESQAKLNHYMAALKDREQNLQQLLINAPDAVIVINQDGIINFWNPKAEKIFGWTTEEAVGQTLTSTIIPTQYRQAHEAGMNRYLTTGKAHVLNKTIEITALNKAGDEFYVALTISSVTQGDKKNFIAFIRDISEQKNNQLDLEWKTRELERSNANLEEFAYAASHDLKEPIRKIRIFSDRLRERLKEKLEEEDLRYFERMENASARMSKLIDDLLNYSSVRKSAESLGLVDLNETVKEVREDLELEILEKKAIITTDLLPFVHGHQRQLQQVFQNLIGNALKYSRPGVSPAICIHSREVEGKEVDFSLPHNQLHERFCLIEITDNGIGFEAEDAERIFNVFTRLHGNTQYKGSGIGLSIVKKIIENHHGHVWAISIPDQGSTFHILLPIVGTTIGGDEEIG